MNLSQDTQKQKTPRSRIHYFLSRSLSPAVLSSNGRKRRIFIASVIALNGLALHHSSTHAARPTNRRPAAMLHLSAPSHEQRQRLLQYDILASTYSALILFLAKIRPSSYAKGFNSFIYVKAQGIRGSPITA